MTALRDRHVLRLSVAAGLAVERELLDQAHSGGPGIGVLAWQPVDHALVVPQRYRKMHSFPVAQKALQKARWPILIRSTGGGPVPQSPQTINVALAYQTSINERPASIEESYRAIGEPWCAWLEHFGATTVDLGPVPGSYCDGQFNVRVGGRKLAGTAQRWRAGGHRVHRRTLLIHGTMQSDGDFNELVDVVNEFHTRIGSRDRFRPEAHIALGRAIPDAQSADLRLLMKLIQKEARKVRRREFAVEETNR